MIGVGGAPFRPLKRGTTRTGDGVPVVAAYAFGSDTGAVAASVANPRAVMQSLSQSHGVSRAPVAVSVAVSVAASVDVSVADTLKPQEG